MYLASCRPEPESHSVIRCRTNAFRYHDRDLAIDLPDVRSGQSTESGRSTCAYINSSLTENQIRAALCIAAQGKYKIIYVAPERLNTMRFLDFACQADISMVTVDEAHCISQWGQDFRPSYLEIADFLARLPRRPVVSAFTATATERVKQDITGSLHLQNPVTVVTGFDRPNLFFRVVKRKGGKETDNSILNYVKRHEDESGIIYCATKKNVDSVCELLLQHGILAGGTMRGFLWKNGKRVRMILPMTGSV